MTHDPLCPTQTMCKCKDQECWDCREVILCQCDLIREVRADERDQARQAVAAVPWQSSMLGATVMRAEVVAALDARP